MSQNLSSAAVVIGALRVKSNFAYYCGLLITFLSNAIASSLWEITCKVKLNVRLDLDPKCLTL